MAADSGIERFLLLLTITLSLAPAAVATQYVVGDGSGWTPNYNYASWANGKTFYVGDTLLFQYNPTLYAVDVVSQSDYENCVTTNPLQSYSGGSTTITLTTPSSMYFISPNMYCSVGMKLAINVLAAGTGTYFSPPYYYSSPYSVYRPPPPPFFYNRSPRITCHALAPVLPLLLGYLLVNNI